jgi:hypothetical protein
MSTGTRLREAATITNPFGITYAIAGAIGSAATAVMGTHPRRQEADFDAGDSARAFRQNIGNRSAHEIIAMMARC